MTKLPYLLLVTALALPLLTACGNKSEDSDASSHISRSETYADQGQYRSALLEVRNAIQKDPDNVAHVVRLAELYLDLGAGRQASDLLSPWLSDQREAVALPLAEAYVKQGKQLSAMETLELARPDSPREQTRASLVRAEALRLAGEKAEALALFRSVLDTNPGNVDAVAGQIRSQLDLNQISRALETASAWLEQQGDNAQVLYLKGLAHYRQNQLDQAADTLTDGVAALPASDIFLPVRRNILTLLSRTLTEQGRIAEAQIYNRILAENTGSDSQQQAQAALTAIQEGRVDDAQKTLRDILEINPDNERVAMMLGTLNLQQGNLDEGVSLLTENLDPETTPTPFIRAATMAQVDKGNRVEALKTLKRSIEARPKDIELLAMHGLVALSLPEHQPEGVASLSKALSMEPDRARLRLALAQHYLREDQPEQALAQLRMAFTSQPAEWSTTGLYVALLLREGETAEAAEIRDSLLNGYPDDPMAQLIASIADAGLGRTDVAIARLENLVSDHPERPEPMMALARFYVQQGNNDKAINSLIRAAKLTPDAIQPLQQAGRLYASNHSVEEVVSWLKKTGAENPELSHNTNALTSLVRIRQGRLEEARDLLTEADQDDSPLVLKKAKAQLLAAEATQAASNENWQTARARAAEAVSLQPDNLAFALMPVRISQLEGRMNEAAAALDEVEKTFGAKPPVVLLRTAMIRQQKNTGEAYEYLRAQWRESGDTGLLPGLVALAKETEPAALDELTLAWVEQAPENTGARMVRAEYLMNNQKDAQAIDEYESLLARQPENVAALNNLAWLLRERDRERAITLAARARELAPENPAVLDTYGWILYLNGQQKDAVKHIEKALALAPDNAEIAEHLEKAKQGL
ncbi:tetratricopeptide repeat protein [Marinobacter sp.]|uniref:tetratricopeptide repeat protein n=1 Tax=Marinobacter sp. TaxID=50741 RepID=UPI00384F1C2E